MVEKLQVLKRKAEESISEELTASNVCKRRLEHLKEHASASTSGNFSTGIMCFQKYFKKLSLFNNYLS